MTGRPTLYMGHEFRSELEATWALWFDQNSVAWSYETVRLRIGEGQSYTPDFTLPDHRLLIEVKPATPLPREFRKATWAARLLGGGIAILTGKPDMPHVWRCVRIGDAWGFEHSREFLS